PIDTVGRIIEIFSASPSPADDVLMVGNLGGAFEMVHPGTPGAKWTTLGDGLPHALVLDLHYDYTDNLLVAGTLGRGAWSLNNPFSAGGAPQATAVSGQATASSLSVSPWQPVLVEAGRFQAPNPGGQAYGVAVGPTIGQGAN